MSSPHVHDSSVAGLGSSNGAGGLPTVLDPFDADTHARLDAEVVRKTGGDPGTDDIALYNLLSYVDYDIKAAVLHDEDGGHLDTSISIMLESRPALRALLRSSLEHASFRDVRLLEYLWPPRMNRSSRWITISFIRHAQCFGNVNGPHIPNADMLTPMGETQAKALGQAWKNTRIDAIHCSTLNRAKRTAQAVATAHSGIPTKPPVHATRWLVERNAPARPKRRGAPMEGHEHLSAGPGHHAHEEWRDEPPDGVGETYAEVAARGVHYLLCLFAYHAAVISQPPPSLTDLSEERPEDVPEGIPHIVVVAHNFILCELYEALISWNDDGHTASNADFAQTGWSRHVLCLHGAERDGPGLGGRARLYGRLEQTILRHPDEYNPALCSPGESPNSSPQLLTTPTSTPSGTPHSSGVATVCVDIPLIAA